MSQRVREADRVRLAVEAGQRDVLAVDATREERQPLVGRRGADDR